MHIWRYFYVTFYVTFLKRHISVSLYFVNSCVNLCPLGVTMLFRKNVSDHLLVTVNVLVMDDTDNL